MSESRKTKMARRDFIRGAGLGVGAAAGAAIALAAPARKANADEAKAAGRGYQETEHVKRYYALAKF